MEKKSKSITFLNANTLRFLAMGFMLLDHLWGTIVSGNFWMTCVGRMAFPIFAFQISEGFLHTSDLKRYRNRLLLFAILSEIPFDLMLNGTWFYPFDQNVLFTLLLGLWAISVLDKAKKTPTASNFLLAALKVLGICLLSLVFMVDYKLMGVVTVILFYVCRGFKGAWLCQLVGMILLNGVFFNGQVIPFTIGGFSFEFPQQAFAVFALVFIWLYNGQKGKSSKWLQYAAYAFYPVHALILYLIGYLG